MKKRNNLWWGLVLVCVGALLLLDNLGLLQSLNISAGQLILSVGLITLGIWILWDSTHKPDFETEELTIPFENSEHAHVRMDFGAGELVVNGGAPSRTLLSGTFEGGVSHNVTHDGGTTRVRLSAPSIMMARWSWGPVFHRTWTVALNNAIPMSMTVKAGASDTTLNLTDLHVTRLKLDVGASSIHVKLPARAGYTEVRGSSGVESVNIEVPEGVAARIRTSGALASISVDRSRFPRIEGAHQSPNYETASNKVDIKLDVGVGSISIQ